MNVRLIAALAVVALILVALLVTLSGERGAGVRIGFVTTLTGGASAIGVDMRDAFDLALEHMGGTMAGLPVTVLYEDDAMDPETGRIQTERLVQRDRVPFRYRLHLVQRAAGVGECRHRGRRVRHQRQRRARRNWPGSSARPTSSRHRGRTTRRRWPPAKSSAGAGSTTCTFSRPITRPGATWSRGLERTYTGTVVATDFTQWPGQLDFSAELAKVRAAQPGTVWVFFPGNHGTQFFTQYAQAGLLDEIPLYSTFSVDALNLPAIGELVEGSLLTQHWAPDLDNLANQRFVEDFRAKTGRTPSFYASPGLRRRDADPERGGSGGREPRGSRRAAGGAAGGRL